MARLTASIVLATVVLAGLALGRAAAQGPPEGQLTVAFDASIAPTFLDPAETPGIGTPFVFLYALHDALVKPMPGNDMAPSLATSWKESADGLAYEFRLREGLKFHNGDPFTAEDVKFSFQRYRGAGAKLLHERVKTVEVLDPARVRFVLQAPWPDFLTFYATPATGAAWIVPQEVRREGRRGPVQAPAGRTGALSIRAHDAGRGGRVRGQRAVLAQEADHQARRHQGRRRPHDPSGHAEDGRSRHRLSDGRRRSDDDQGRSPAAPGPDDPARHLVARIPGAVESEVALARSPRPAGGHAGHRQADHQRGRASWLLPPDGVDHPERDGVRAEARALSLRRRPSQAPADRGRLSQRLRRRRSHPVAALHDVRRGADQLAGGGRDPHAGARDGARDLHGGVARQEAVGRHRDSLGGAGRQRGHPYRELRAQHRAVRLRRLPGHRRPLPATGAGARPQEARGAAASDPAPDARARDVRPDLGAGDAARRGAARRAARDRPQPPTLLRGALRGDPSQAAVRFASHADGFPDASHVVVDVTEQAEHDELLGRHG